MIIDSGYKQPSQPAPAQPVGNYEWNSNIYTPKLSDVLSGNYAPSQGWSQGGWQSMPNQSPVQTPPQGNPYSGGSGSGNSYWNTPSTGLGQIQR